MKYNLIKIMVALGYTERGAKGIITRRKNECNISIDDYTKVSTENVIRILDTLSKKEIASIIARLEDFISKEDEIETSEDQEDFLQVDSDKGCNLDEGKDKEPQIKIGSQRENKKNTELKDIKKAPELDYLGLKNKNLTGITRGVPSSAYQQRRKSNRNSKYNGAKHY